MVPNNNYLITYYQYKPSGHYQGGRCEDVYFTSKEDALVYLGQKGPWPLLEKSRYQKSFGYRPLKLLKTDPAQYITFDKKDQTTTTASIVPI